VCRNEVVIEWYCNYKESNADSEEKPALKIPYSPVEYSP